MMEVDVLDFLVPVENNKTLFVWNIEAALSEAQLYEHLSSIFSSFGPLYLLKLRPSPPSFSALVKFFSALQAAAAQRHTDGRSLFQTRPLKVQLSSKQTPHFLSSRPRPLSHAHCLNLANHCLGFDGWTSDIITLKELTNEEEEEEEDGEGEGGRWRRLRFGCIMSINFPRHQRSTRGGAVVEDRFTCTDPGVYLQKRSQLQKRVRDRALVQAFSTVLLLLLEGKVMVEVKQTSDQCEPEPSGLLQVNEFSWSDFGPDEDEAEDEEWDLTVS